MKIYSAKRIYTMEKRGKWIEAIAVEDGLIKDYGALDMLVSRYPYAKIQVFSGYMYPGFNDSHLHLLGTGKYQSLLDLSKAQSISTVKDMIESYAKDRDFVLGRGWNQESFIEKRMLSLEDLDSICDDKPVVLMRACGHILVANTKAMKLAGISSGYEDGIFREKEMDLIKKILPIDDIDAYKVQIENACTYFSSFGITSVQSDDLAGILPENHKDVLGAFIEMDAQNRLNVRINEQLLLENVTDLKSFIDSDMMNYRGNKFSFGPLKILGDGSLGARTAALELPYSDTASMGIFNHTDEELHDLIATAQKINMDVAIHAIGDGMLTKAVNALEKLQFKGARNAIVHCQVNTQAMLGKMARLGIGAHIQPVFLKTDPAIALSRLGFDRLRHAYNYSTILDYNIKVAFGSDSPVEEPNVILGVYLAVTRSYKGTKFHEDEAIDAYTALELYTSKPPYFSREENTKGLIKPGMLADFTVLDIDILDVASEVIKDAKVSATHLGDKFTYLAAGL